MLLRRTIFFRLSVFCLALAFIPSSYSQQFSNWYFGNGATLSFGTISFPMPYTLAPSSMTTSEACASVSDASGSLLFYTNGQTVFNRFNEIMANGTSLSGHESAAQGALIIPMPGNDSLFYIFTTDAIENNFKNGYQYSIVNINKDGGKGAVTVKNKILQSSCTERLTAVRHTNEVDVWIITNDKSSNIFRAWLLSCNGLASAAVTSVVGDVLDQTDRFNIGNLKVSPDGKKICQTFFADDIVSSQHNFFQLFDFDNSTGQLTNAKRISVPNANAFACEFSPDSKLLYLTDPYAQKISQVDCSLATASAIAASSTTIPSSFGYYAIQLGPDNKIYLDKDKSFLSVISFPDIKGKGCLLEENKISLGADGRIGLPSILKDLTETGNDITFSYADSCKGIIQFNGQTTLQNAQWEWNFGDGSISNSKNPVHIFSLLDRMYLVTVKIKSPGMCGVILKSKYIVPKGILAKADFSFAGKCDSGYVKFTNTSHYLDSLRFLWSFDDGTYSTDINPIHTFPGSGSYQVSLLLETSNQCTDNTVTKTLDLKQLDIHASGNLTVLEGNSVQLHASGNALKFEWTPAIWLNNPKIANPIAVPEQTITYYVTGMDNLGCVDVDSVLITVKTFDDVHVPSAFSPNDDGLNDIFKPRVGIKFALVNFSVYDRWGKMVFSTSQKDKGWNGKLNNQLQPSGVYIWSLKILNNQGKQITKSGTVLLIR